MHYFFELGHQPHISIAELQAIFSQDKIIYNTIRQTNEYLIIESDKEIDAQKLITKLGGTIKIGKDIEKLQNIKETIIDFLLQNSEGKIHFSVTGKNAKKIALDVKKELKNEGKSVRYIEPKNTATILHNNLVEKKSDFTIVEQDVFVTMAIQDIEDFSKRDYDRPGSDNVSGMLPPKLARIMINLSQADLNDTILDPFCGSGTILTEALSLGYTKLIGSDLSKKAISDTQKNIDWFLSEKNKITIEQSNNPPLRGARGCSTSVKTTKAETPPNPPQGGRANDFKFFISDATKLSTLIKPNSIDTIISEPYMGKPLRGRETTEQLQKQAQELATLYTESFTQFYKLLKKDGVVIFIIPKFIYGNEWITINCLKNIEKIGFEIIPFNEKNISLLYHRPKQFVGREIWKLKKH